MTKLTCCIWLVLSLTQSSTWVIVPDGFHDDRHRNDVYPETVSRTGEKKRTLAGFPFQQSGVLRWQSMEFADEDGRAEPMAPSAMRADASGSSGPHAATTAESTMAPGIAGRIALYIERSRWLADR